MYLHIDCRWFRYAALRLWDLRALLSNVRFLNLQNGGNSKSDTIGAREVTTQPSSIKRETNLILLGVTSISSSSATYPTTHIIPELYFTFATVTLLGGLMKVRERSVTVTTISALVTEPTYGIFKREQPGR